MIDKPMQEVRFEDLQQLIDEQVREDRRIEYKREVGDGKDKFKFDFLAAISSFANTEGGDLLYGMRAQDGMPLEICPLQDLVEDPVLLKLESWARTTLDPRLPPLNTRFVPVPGGKILLIRVAKSLAAPHRIKMNESGPFYARTSSGKYPMDTAELRAAFTGDALAERLQAWRNERITAVHRHHVPIQVELGCKLVLHLVPRGSLGAGGEIDLRLHADRLGQLHPMGRDGLQHTSIRLDGVLNHSTISANGRCFAYTHVLRSGIVEAVSVFQGHLQSVRMERHLMHAVRNMLPVLEQAGAMGPYTILIALVGAHGCEFTVPSAFGPGFTSTPCPNELVVLPGAEVGGADEPLDSVMRPLLDRIWNSFGYAGSPSFSDDGRWSS